MRQSTTTNLLIVLLILCGYITAAVLAAVDSGDTALLIGALAGVIVAVSFAWPFTRAWRIGTLAAIVYYIGLQVYRMAGTGSIMVGLDRARPVLGYAPSAVNYALPVAAGVLCLGVAGLLGNGVARRLFKAEAQLERDATVIRELTIHDGDTGALKMVYADTLLTDEIERSRRYKHTLSLVLLGPDDWQAIVRERGDNEATEALKLAGQVIKESLRNVDIVSYREQARFAVILPETAVAGACVAAERLCHSLASRTSILFRAGVAEFPSDAVSKAELINEADAALKFARSASLNVASRVLLT
ncbi:MAG: diguanylate cyclase [Bacteroidetes bacterium]|nr:diguanylate cyclase [Bacteroidota bacterium]MCL5025013.1 diguanylate cyclase [Chloroflexota bacterium]